DLQPAKTYRRSSFVAVRDESQRHEHEQQQDSRGTNQRPGTDAGRAGHRLVERRRREDRPRQEGHGPRETRSRRQSWLAALVGNNKWSSNGELPSTTLDARQIVEAVMPTRSTGHSGAYCARDPAIAAESIGPRSR